MRKLIIVDDLENEIAEVIQRENPDLISFSDETPLSQKITEKLNGMDLNFQFTDLEKFESRFVGGKHLSIVTHTEERDISIGLMKYINQKDTIVLAQKTERSYFNKSLFLISIPKAGTHLLYRLAELFGFERGITFNDFTKPKNWYCLEFSNSHTKAKDFFIDSVRRNYFGNRQHPFLCNPAILIYRNPLDILISEASYYHMNDNTIFSGYFSGLSMKERINLLIDDPHLMGTLRDRINDFLPWLQFPNVIPLSFEELVGQKGNGSDEIQQDLIWSLQLKLQIPGRPSSFAKSLFDPNSPTFNKGEIGKYREHLTNRQFERIKALKQDFMEAFGYHNLEMGSESFFSEKIYQFRKKPLGFIKQTQKEAPVLVGTELFGYNLIRYKELFYAYPCGEKIDLQEYLFVNPQADLLYDHSLDNLKHRLASMIHVQEDHNWTKKNILLRKDRIGKIEKELTHTQKEFSKLKEEQRERKKELTHTQKEFSKLKEEQGKRKKELTHTQKEFSKL
ncbi:MAG: hypothetical protein GY710_18150, partial [Desulfobacteraceae bacterium]|nr:hypothetical protein [Desulfobacteraceae bacterium]